MNKSVRCASLFFLFIAHVFFMHATTVTPIVPGEGVWNVVSRIGECVDERVIVCEVIITQSEVGIGGTYTISNTSNVRYCITEDINFTTGAAISIDGVSNIEIDFQGRTIDGLSSGENAIMFVGSDSEDVTIENGSVSNLTGNAVTAADGITVTRPTIRNMEFFDIDDNAIEFSEPNLLINDLLVENCRFKDCPSIDSVRTDGAIVRNCDMHFGSNMVFTDNVALRLTGTDTFSGRYVCVQDCLLTNSGSAAAGQCLIQNAESVLVDRVKLLCPFSILNFAFSNIDSLHMRDCVAASNPSNIYYLYYAVGPYLFEQAGFSFENVRSGAIERCSSSALLMGFLLDNCSNIIFSECSVSASFFVGFSIANASNNIVLDSCFANRSTNDSGFSFDTTTTQCKVRNCCTIGNDSFGYENNAPLGANIFIGNVSVNDGSGGIGGSGGVDPVLVNVGPAAAAGGTSWTNVVIP